MLTGPGHGGTDRPLPIEHHYPSDDTWHPLTATACYRPHTDPIAVSLILSDDDDEQLVIWQFARALLHTGLEAAVGDGDVVIWPSRPAWLNLWLCSPSGSCWLRSPTAPVQAFLDETLAILPVADETQQLTDIISFDLAQLQGSSP